MLTADEATQVLVWACQGPYKQVSWVTVKEFTPAWHQQTRPFVLEQIQPYKPNKQTNTKAHK